MLRATAPLFPRAVRRVVFAATSSAALLCVANARAQATDPAAAEELFGLGRAALAKGDLEIACQRFEESLRLEPTAGTLLNLGACEVLGLPLTTLSRWVPEPSLLQVEVGAFEVRAEATAAEPIMVELPSGLRVHGLTLEGVVALHRRLS